MKYVLLWSLLGIPQPQLGAFDNLFACEQAANQVRLLAQKPQQVRTVCINLAAKPHHWNGKAVPK